MRLWYLRWSTAWCVAAPIQPELDGENGYFKTIHFKRQDFCITRVSLSSNSRVHLAQWWLSSCSRTGLWPSISVSHTWLAFSNRGTRPKHCCCENTALHRVEDTTLPWQSPSVHLNNVIDLFIARCELAVEWQLGDCKLRTCRLVKALVKIGHASGRLALYGARGLLEWSTLTLLGHAPWLHGGAYQTTFSVATCLWTLKSYSQWRRRLFWTHIPQWGILATGINNLQDRAQPLMHWSAMWP